MSGEKELKPCLTNEEIAELKAEMSDRKHALLKSIMDQREDVAKAFLAKYGCEPDQVEQVEQHTENGTIWFLRLRATPPGTETVPEGTMAIIKAHVGEAYQIAVIKGMALSHIINGSATADKEAFTFANQKNDWGRISKSMRRVLDALAITRPTQPTKETPNAQG